MVKEYKETITSESLPCFTRLPPGPSFPHISSCSVPSNHTGYFSSWKTPNLFLNLVFLLSLSEILFHQNLAGLPFNISDLGSNTSSGRSFLITLQLNNVSSSHNQFIFIVQFSSKHLSLFVIIILPYLKELIHVIVVSQMTRVEHLFIRQLINKCYTN